MALTQPILYTKNAFDATQSTVFEFNVISGNQVVANKLIIKNNVTLAVVYEQEQVTYRFQHNLPAGTLTNGSYYQAVIVTKDAKGEYSIESNPIQFYCYAQPSFAFTNMPLNNIISNSSFEFEVTFNQTEGETLNAYIFNLYNVNGVLLSTSNTQYNTISSLPTKIYYMFSGFDDDTEYVIECKGVTTQGTEIYTGQVHFTVSYVQPSLYSTFFLTNNCDGGYVNIHSNVVGIPGFANPSPPIFIDGKEVDLRPEGSYIEWNEGFTIPYDATIRVWGRNFTPNTEILHFKNNKNDYFSLKYCQDDTNAWVELRVVHNDWEYGYTTQSNLIVLPKVTDYIFIWLRRIDNLYELKIENLGEGVIV